LVNGELRAEGFIVGPFYAVRNRYLYPVDARLGIHPDAVMAGVYEPDEGTLGPMAEGAGHAVVDAVEGVVNVVVHPINTVEGLAQLPAAVKTLIESSPEYWEQFRALPHGAQVRAVSRLITNVVILCGTAGAGASGAASLGGKLGRLRLAVLSLSAEGALALRSVVVPAGQLVTAVGAAPGAVYVLHMAKAGAEGAGRPAPRPGKGPGRWKTVKPSGSERAQLYQQQITGRPASEVYRIGDVEFDGFTEGVLLEAKGPGYKSFFEVSSEPKPWYERSGKFGELLDQARAQAKLAKRLGLRLRWHVAESEVATSLIKIFEDQRLSEIEVVYTPAAP
jgi:hypothetical protein